MNEEMKGVIRQIVRVELAAHREQLNQRMNAVEQDLILSKQHMLETVEAISTSFSTELTKLMDEQVNSCVEVVNQALCRYNSKSQ